MTKSFRFVSRRFVHLQRRILRRFFEVRIGDLQVMLAGDGHAVADPGRRHMHRPAVGQFRLTCAAEVLPQLGPRLKARTFDDPVELGAEIGRCVSVTRDAEVGAVFCLVEGVLQIGQQFGEDWDLARTVPYVVFSLRAGDLEPAVIPVDITPLQQQGLGGDAQAAIPRQGKEQPPLGIRAGIQNGLCLLLADVGIPSRVGTDSGNQICKRVVLDQTRTLRGLHEMLGLTAAAAHSVLCQPAFEKIQPPTVRITRRDLAEWFIFAEESYEVLLGTTIDSSRRWLHIAAAVDVLFQERT